MKTIFPPTAPHWPATAPGSAPTPFTAPARRVVAAGASSAVRSRPRLASIGRLLSLLAALALAVSPAQAAQQLWTCGMHPQIIKTEPGNCPICGMKLTPIKHTGAPGERIIKSYRSTMNPGEVSPTPGKDSMGMDMVPVYEDAPAATAIMIDPATAQRMNLRTGVATQGPVERDIRTVGTITFNEEGLRDITTKYEGWIEKLFVDATWTRVKAGDPLFEIYSPDLYNAELNYLVARRGEGEDGGPLTRAALGRLRLFDVPDALIDELKRTGKAERTFVFRAPAAGVVIEKAATVGQMVKPGERLYRTADLSTVWVLAQVYEKDLPFVHAGQAVEIATSYGATRSYPGRISLVLPEVEEQTRAATARIELPNPDGALRPGMFVDVRFHARIADTAVLIPEEAVLRSGDHNTVFVARADGTFEPREVELGVRAGHDDYEVVRGVSAGERIVISGQFLLDSESQLQQAIEKMSSGAAMPAPASTPPPAARK